MKLIDKLETALNLIGIINSKIDEPAVHGTSTLSFLLNQDEETKLQEYLESHRSLCVSGYNIFITRPTKYYPKWLANFHKA